MSLYLIGAIVIAAVPSLLFLAHYNDRVRDRWPAWPAGQAESARAS